MGVGLHLDQVYELTRVRLMQVIFGLRGVDVVDEVGEVCLVVVLLSRVVLE